MIRSLWICLASFALCAAAAAPARAQDADADGILDLADAFPCDPGAFGVLYAPAAGTSGTTLFEDQWPSAGDLDFNDLVVGWHYALRAGPGGITRLDATFDLRAAGALIQHAVALGLPVPVESVASVRRRVDGGAWAAIPTWTEGNAVVTLSANAHEAFDPLGLPFINTEDPAAAVPAARIELEIVFATPVALDVSDAPFDLFISRLTDPGHEIHAPDYAGTSRMNPALFGTFDDGSTPGRLFVDQQGLPFAIHLFEDVAYPSEGVAIAEAYPDVVAFAASAGTTHADFAARPVATALFPAQRRGALPLLARDGSCQAEATYVVGSGPVVLTGRTVETETGAILTDDQVARLQALVDGGAEDLSAAVVAVTPPLVPHIRSGGFSRDHTLPLPRAVPYDMPATVRYQPCTWSGDSDASRFVLDSRIDPAGAQYTRILDTGYVNWTSSGWPWNGPLRTTDFTVAAGTGSMRFYGACTRRHGSYCSAVVYEASVTVNPDLPPVGAVLTLR